MQNVVMTGCIHPRSNWGRRRSRQRLSGVGDRLRRIHGLAVMDFPGRDKEMRKILGTSMFIGSESRRPSFGNLDAVPVIAITDIE